MKASGVPKLFRLADLEKADRRFRREWWPLKSFGGDWVTNGHFFARCIPNPDRVIKQSDGFAVGEWAGALDTRERVPVRLVGEHASDDRLWTVWQCRRRIATVLFEGYAALLDGLKVVRLLDQGGPVDSTRIVDGADSMYPLAGIDGTGKVAIVIMPRLP